MDVRGFFAIVGVGRGLAGADFVNNLEKNSRLVSGLINNSPQLGSGHFFQHFEISEIWEVPWPLENCSLSLRLAGGWLGLIL